MNEPTLKTKSGPVPVSQMSLDDLEWYATMCKNRESSEIAKNEIARRKGGGNALARQPEPPPARSTALAPRNRDEAQRFVGTLRDPAAITQAFREMAEVCNLVTPATACGALPEGCEIATSLVFVNGTLPPGEKGNGEVFVTDGGKLALTKTSLDRISQAAGVSWIPEKSGRADDRKDARYVEWRAVGKWRLFDGLEHVETRNRAADLRDGSDEIKGMSEKQIIQQRKFILTLAESKAMNRVVRALGIKQSYTAEELAKPFAVCRLMFTGRTDNPELAREFALRTQAAMQGTIGALYGKQDAPALPPKEQETIETQGEVSPSDASPSDASDDELPPARTGTDKY